MGATGGQEHHAGLDRPGAAQPESDRPHPDHRRPGGVPVPQQEVIGKPARESAATPIAADCLKNALRQAPDCILIGEIRDRETMTRRHRMRCRAIWCLTLHANNSYQALNRILSSTRGSARHHAGRPGWRASNPSSRSAWCAPAAAAGRRGDAQHQAGLRADRKRATSPGGKGHGKSMAEGSQNLEKKTWRA